MNNRFFYEAELKHNEQDGYSVVFPQFEDDAYSYGKDLSESIMMAAEVLELTIAAYLDEGEPLPEPIIKGHSSDVLRVVVSVEVTPELRERMKCVTVTEAADMLDVTKGRVSQLLDSGILRSIPYGNERLVTLESINERITNPRGAGRPKKAK